MGTGKQKTNSKPGRPAAKPAAATGARGAPAARTAASGASGRTAVAATGAAARRKASGGAVARKAGGAKPAAGRPGAGRKMAGGTGPAGKRATVRRSAAPADRRTAAAVGAPAGERNGRPVQLGGEVGDWLRAVMDELFEADDTVRTATGSFPAVRYVWKGHVLGHSWTDRKNRLCYARGEQQFKPYSLIARPADRDAVLTSLIELWRSDEPAEARRLGLPQK